ncbi:MAG: SMP-30/gluconolactonase/LRE family protein [Bacteroidales bacterium]|nr:SMP-30/gluconolactonase/LRE family protein [Bacteroidales bacterium]
MRKTGIFLLALVFTITIEAQKSTSLQNAQLFSELPDYCPTPDAFAIAPDGTLTLSCPNYADGNTPGVLMRIFKDGSYEKIGELPGIDEKRKARPVGLAYDEKGILYVCDNQGPNKSRVLAVILKNGRIEKTEVVAKGMTGPNGLRYNNGAIYVTTPQLPKYKTEKLTSGVYRFGTNERDVLINGDSNDAHLIFTTQTQNPDRQFGLDGLAFNKKGQLLVGDFGDGKIYKLILNKDGRVKKSSVFAQLPNTAGIDGMYMDFEDNVYVAGFSQNQIYKVDKKGKYKVIADYPDNDGSNGELDQPADLIVYNGKLIIANFDLMVTEGMINSEHSIPYTLSYIDL